MAISDYLGTGMDITFKKEGGAPSAGDTDTQGDGSDPDAGDGAAASVQEIWNGSWYGCFWVTKPTYEEVCEKIGSKGQFNAPCEGWLPETLYVKWSTPDGTSRLTMTFKAAEDGTLRYRSGGISSTGA